MNEQLKKPLFSKDFYYPDMSNPEFKVSSIEAGYKFQFFNSDKSERTADSFSIGAKIVDNKHEATGYQGEKGDAIETFRSFILP